jgi:hypothetical protein
MRPANAGGLLSAGELAQGNENAAQNGMNVTLVSGATGSAISAPVAGTAFSAASPQTITLGATAQTVFAANAARAYFLFLNTSDTIMYLDVTGATATNTAIPIAASTGKYEPLVAPTGAISVLCATTGKAFVALQG